MNISPPPLPHGRQNTPSSPPINTTDTLQITVSYKTRTIALRVNDGPIIADLLPDIARRLGILDPSIVYGGYRLLTSDGDPLSPAKTLREQHVPNHSTLTLEPGASSDTDIIYDDVVEAVGASVQHVYRPWTSDHTTFTSLVIGLGMLVISAGWIALFPASIWASVLAFGFSAILLALTAALCGKTCSCNQPQSDSSPAFLLRLADINSSTCSQANSHCMPCHFLERAWDSPPQAYS